MKTNKLATAARILLGAILVFAGGMYFAMMAGLLPPPPAMEGAAGAFMEGLMASGYLMTVVKVLEVVFGLLLLFNQWTKLVLVLLAPLSVNFVLFHVFLAPAGGILAYVAFLLNAYLLWVNRDAYEELLER
ncbi:DoxX protein [Candidatus Woesearchaeota archaeon]|nr:MAG: DoxX protein [Candidatus Woesearchaeota archaeon]